MLLSSVRPHLRAGMRVAWRDDYKPTSYPHAHGVVFLSSGRQTYVTWDGQTRPALIATVALEVVK